LTVTTRIRDLLALGYLADNPEALAAIEATIKAAQPRA
jgi:hypothetical protein